MIGVKVMVKMTQLELEKLVNSLSVTYFGKPYKDEVTFNNRLRTTGGRYIPSQRRIELNPKYLDEMDDDEFYGIIKHELCHYHLHIEGKGYKHRDFEFKQLLKQTGSPRFCQPLPSEIKKRSFKYICTDCGQVYLRKKRIQTNRYRCGKCKGRLKREE